jgi:hypothetical protein
LIDSKAGAIVSPDFDCDDLQAERASRCAHLTHLRSGRRIRGIEHDCHAAETRDDLAQQVKSFATQLRGLLCEACDVATRSRHARDQAVDDRVREQCEDDRSDRCGLLCRDHRSGHRRENDIDFQPDELRRDLGEALSASFRPPILDRKAAPLNPTEFAQPLNERSNPFAVGCRCAGDKNPDSWRLPRLLRPRYERSCDSRASENRDKLAALHIPPPPGIRER